VGTSSLSLPDGGTSALTAPGVGGNVGAAFGSALQRADGLRTVIHDDYNCACSRSTWPTACRASGAAPC
jgi:hypothetical protein